MPRSAIRVASAGLAVTLGAATSACASSASKISSAVSSAASSASAAAKDQLDRLKNGVNASGDVTVGAVATDSDGRTTAPVAIKNSTSTAASFAVEVNFKDADGKLLDAVVVTASGVQPGQSTEATARSTHKLDGATTASAGTALRH